MLTAKSFEIDSNVIGGVLLHTDCVGILPAFWVP